MKIQIKGTEVELAYTFRALMVYENITGKSFKIGSSVSDLIYLFFSIIQGSLMKARSGVEITWDEFQDYLDDNPGAINDFSEWLLEVVSTESFMTAKTEEKSSSGKKKLPKK